MEEEKTPTEKPKKKMGFFKKLFLFIFLLLLLLIITGGILVALALRLPQKYGLVKPNAEKVFEYTPDRDNGEKILEAAQSQGLPTEGVSLYVLPRKESNRTVAYTVFDASQGFRFDTSMEENAILQSLVTLARSQATNDAKVEVVAIEYKDEDGKSLITLAAPTQTILDFADKKISDEQFMTAMSGQTDIQNITERAAKIFSK